MQTVIYWSDYSSTSIKRVSCGWNNRRRVQTPSGDKKYLDHCGSTLKCCFVHMAYFQVFFSDRLRGKKCLYLVLKQRRAEEEEAETPAHFERGDKDLEELNSVCNVVFMCVCVCTLSDQAYKTHPVHQTGQVEKIPQTVLACLFVSFLKDAEVFRNHSWHISTTQSSFTLEFGSMTSCEKDPCNGPFPPQCHFPETWYLTWLLTDTVFNDMKPFFVTIQQWVLLISKDECP